MCFILTIIPNRIPNLVNALKKGMNPSVILIICYDKIVEQNGFFILVLATNLG